MAVVAKVFKGFGRQVERDRRKFYSLHVSHPAQGEVSIKFSVLKDGTWERAHGKAIAIARMIMDYLNTPCDARLLYLQDEDVLGVARAEQLIGLTDDSMNAWAGFVAQLKFPPESPAFWDGNTYGHGMVMTTRRELMGGSFDVVDADKEYLRAIAL